MRTTYAANIRATPARIALALACFCSARHAKRVQLPERRLQRHSYAQHWNAQADESMSGSLSLAEARHSHCYAEIIAALLLGIREPVAGWRAAGHSCRLIANVPGKNRAGLPLTLCAPVVEEATRQSLLGPAKTSLFGPAAKNEVETGTVQSYDQSQGRGTISCSSFDGSLTFEQKDLPMEVKLSPPNKQNSLIIGRTVTFSLLISAAGMAQAIDLKIKDEGFNYEKAMMVYSEILDEQCKKRFTKGAAARRERLQMVCSAIRVGEWSIVNATLDTEWIWSVGQWRGMLHAAWQVNDWKGTLQLLHRMELAGHPCDADAVEYAISACAKNNMAGMASELLLKLNAAGAEVKDRAYQQVIFCWARSNNWQAALQLLESTPPAARQLWQFKSVFSSCQKAMRWKEALELLRSMEGKGLVPDSQCYSLVATACLKSDQKEEADKIMKQLNASFAVSATGVDANAEPRESAEFAFYQTLTSLVRGGRSQEAVKMYNEMPPHIECDGMIVNAAVDAASKGKDWRVPVRILNDAMAKNILPRTAAFNMVLNRLAATTQYAVSLRLFRRMSKTGVRPNMLTYNAVLRVLSQAGQWQLAVSILREMARAGVKPDLLCYNHALGACVKRSKLEASKRALTTRNSKLSATALLPPESINVDDVIAIDNTTENVYEGLGADAKEGELKLCGTAGEQAVELLLDMQGRGLKPNVVSYSSVIAVLSASGEYSAIFGLLGSMEENEIKPNEFTWTSAIAACERAGQWQLALGIFDALRNESSVDPSVWNAAISAAGSSGDVQLARELLDEMRSAGLDVTARTYNKMLSGCEKSGDGSQAMDVLTMMKSDGVQPDKISYALAIIALGRDRKWEAALGLWEQMLKEEVDIDSKSLGTLLRVLTYCGQWEKSLETFKRARAIMPNICREIVFAAALEACAAGAAGETALELISEMVKKNLVPSVACYHGVCAACAAAGDWPSTLDAFQEMVKQEMQPLPETWEIVYDTCIKAGREGEADMLIGYAERLGVPLSTLTRKVAWTDVLRIEY
mmetsp:Transcript_3006/g.4839  ORF Transcript_3006/g.4839 Transcript_3006/m.4839 type:complete len:1032 (-) Transcript_3006:47-3142(-)